MVPIKQNLVDKAKWPLKCPYTMTPKYVVIHNTANDAPAANEIAYMRSNSIPDSFHYAVDDKQIVQGIPENRNSWNAGDGDGPGNRQGIAIEICYSKSGGSKFDAAERNAAEFAASLLKKYGWGIDQLKKHQDFNGKYCPHRTLDRGWDRFVKMVQGYLTPATAKPTVIDKTPDVTYRVRAGGKWLPAVTNLKDYAGIVGTPITDVAIKVSSGTVKYRAHVKNGKWLPYVTGYNLTDFDNGYAGNGKQIDAIEVIFTPAKGTKARKAKYRVSATKGSFWPWQLNADKNKKQGLDGYAGVLGVSIDRLQISIE